MISIDLLVNALTTGRLWIGNCLAGILIASTLVACQTAKDKAAEALGSELRNRLQLAEQPLPIHSIQATYDTFQPGQTVTIAGRIYAESLSPFDANEATFTIIELPKPGHNHEDPGDCPFCRRELRNAKFAMVKVLGDDGKIAPYSADRLLGLQKNQDVVVIGRAEQVGETIIVSLEKYYLLEAAASEVLSAQFRESARQVSSASQEAT